jgi:hypothetical protein
MATHRIRYIVGTLYEAYVETTGREDAFDAFEREYDATEGNLWGAIEIEDTHSMLENEAVSDFTCMIEGTMTRTYNVRHAVKLSFNEFREAMTGDYSLMLQNGRKDEIDEKLTEYDLFSSHIDITDVELP